MASVQCHKTCEESCKQKNQQGSFGQKVAELFRGHHNDHSNAGIQTQTGHATAKTQTTQCSYSQTQTTTTHPTNKTRREHKTNLIHKIKDGLSGHSSDSGSSSESDSDNEGCQKRKN